MPVSERKKAYMKEWREKNKEKLKLYNNAHNRRWREANREKQREYWRKWRVDNHTGLLVYQKQWRQSRGVTYRKHLLKKKFGMTPDDFKRLFESQNGLCAICLHPSEKTLNIDHDHETGKVRGLLCHNCNLTLGRMKESPENLRAAAEYLEYFRFLRTWRAA